MKFRGLIVTLCLIVIWLAITEGGFISPLFLPSPIMVARELYAGFSEGIYLTDCGATAWRWLCGYVIGAPIGVAVGISMGTSRTLNEQCEFPGYHYWRRKERCW